MKSIVNRVMVALLLVTLASVAAFAKGKRIQVSVLTDTKVNGTLVKHGTYDVVFDEQTGELSIVKGSKIVATTTTRLEQRESKRALQRQTRLLRAMRPDWSALRSAAATSVWLSIRAACKWEQANKCSHGENSRLGPCRFRGAFPLPPSSSAAESMAPFKNPH